MVTTAADGGVQDGADRTLWAAGITGVVLGEDGESVLSGITELLAAHRVWDRFPAPRPEAG
ncbi:hypothetical protein [Kitasatospora arboriphila]|uniref:Uncharacterized protein n=1 Tax=Kitasatospora arboriphila TaxID=258052 RepID=A0ABN1TE56_9ACTN